MSSCQKSAVRCLTQAAAPWLRNTTNSRVSERLVTRGRGQPAGKEADSETSDVNEPFLVQKSAPPAHRSSHDVSRRTVGGIAGAKCCEGTRSTAESSRRSWKVPQVCIQAHASSGRRRRNRRGLGRVFQRWLCPESSSSWFTASCCCDGLLAFIRPLWVWKTFEVPPVFECVATAHTCTHSTSTACTSLGRHCNTTRLSQSSSCGSVHPHLAGHVRPSEVLALRKKDLAPPLVPPHPCDRGHRNRIVQGSAMGRSM